MASIDPNIDPYGYLGITQNSDGSITRRPEFLATCTADSDPKSPVLIKDIPINQQNNTWARLYLPAPESGAAPATKRPLLVYYHGGGFILCSAASSIFHAFCSRLAAEIPALVVSVEYRLAPEHRLPAAYDDSAEALDWIRTAGDEWLTDYADFSNCFLMGTSAGGNIAYHVGLRECVDVDQPKPLKIQGLILHQPFFGGVERTPSEIRLAGDKVLPPLLSDIMWDLSLPVGVDQDHEYSNPIRAVRLDVVEKVKDQGLRLLVTGCDGDPLVDRQIELVKMLKDKGVDVVDQFSDGGFHGCEIFDDSKAIVLYAALKKFVLNS
ncbi:hypothetical protein ABFS82_06G040000 [Erythranthe guttata]|uniref:Alpha/beta hydrolase fold-3 domain-containing protein n=1 Tax=Erythranthe guttata TaxID=4155 RepID=A0A022QCQ7_ERYGU|nr:PREDICTED: probable carboxylesterase 120 [Erythranthe guttata]EYU25033.1 hypothetical protein MIMGU_mgv1a010087mg [Erythranthe guttata]|eukprot:XP_012851984.1 PREDICTED: probable carboxylesterase 120 [Erythranthe guttata]